jgi:arylsulfatase A-like enzyme
MDLMPTFLEAAGVKPPPGIEGRSILPTLLGQAQAPETRCLFFSSYAGHTEAAVLHGDWKLVQNKPGEPLELYNLKDDPQEKTNLAGASPRPGQYDELKVELDKYVKSAEAVEWRRPSQRKQ